MSDECYTLMDYLKAKAWLKLADSWRDDLAKGAFVDVIVYAQRVYEETQDEELREKFPRI